MMWDYLECKNIIMIHEYEYVCVYIDAIQPPLGKTLCVAVAKVNVRICAYYYYVFIFNSLTHFLPI